MFAHKTTLKHPATCAFCGQHINPGHTVIVDYTLLGRRYYHQICRYDMELADRFGFTVRVRRVY